jgi:pimeloyl-ACP methyl ester carboxylesterase
VILVGHSWGGSVINTEAGADQRVKALVYVAAFAPDKGETASSLAESVAPTILPSILSLKKEWQKEPMQKRRS